MMLTNRGAPLDTSHAWSFYRRVREQFSDWNHVVLTFAEEPERTRGGECDFKIVHFVDDHGNTLELDGVNYGYAGGAPKELLQILISEGFSDSPSLGSVVLNPAGDNEYPQTIPRDQVGAELVRGST